MLIWREVETKTANISFIKDMMVLGMASMVESRDNSTGGHIMRTSDVIKVFTNRLIKYADRFKVTEDFLKKVIKAAPMHDLGKITVDDCILRKQGKFTEEEYEQMKRHAEEGEKIVNHILADVFDALVSKRCYKEEFSYEEAYEIIEESLGTHFDPELGKIFLECGTELEKLYDYWKKNEYSSVSY